MEIPRARVQTSDYFEDNQLKHGQREGERRRENQLHEHMPDLVVPKQLLHKEDPSSDKENNLTHRKENCRLISNKKINQKFSKLTCEAKIMSVSSRKPISLDLDGLSQAAHYLFAKN